MSREAQKPTGKRAAILDAVVALMSRGEEVDAIKVADIAREAGIGKGTVYEYFSSKDELLAKAMLYDIQNTFEQIQTVIESADTFYDKLERSLLLLAKKGTDTIAYFQLFSGNSALVEIGNCFQAEMKFGDTRGVVQRMFRQLLASGVAEGLISRNIDWSRWRITLSGAISGFIHFIKDREEYADLSTDDAIKHIYAMVIGVS